MRSSGGALSVVTTASEMIAVASLVVAVVLTFFPAANAWIRPGVDHRRVAAV